MGGLRRRQEQTLSKSPIALKSAVFFAPKFTLNPYNFTAAAPREVATLKRPSCLYHTLKTDGLYGFD
jgi:hypothetical protein